MLRIESNAPSAASIKKEINPLNMSQNQNQNQNHCRIFKTCTGAENIPENFMTSECADGSTKFSDVEKMKLNKKDCEKEMEKNENNDARKSLSISPVLNGRRKARTSILFPVLREAGSPIISPLGNVKGRGSASRRMTLSPATARSLILEVMEEEKEKEGEKVKGEREGEKGKGVNVDEVKEEVREKKDATLTRDLPVNGITSPHTHLPLLLSSPLPFSLTTLTSSSPLVMPLYPPLNSPPANFPLVIMNSKNENEKIIFEERNSTPLNKKFEKTKSGKMSNGTAILNFRILADQKEKAILFDEEKDRNVSLSANKRIFNHVEENKLSTTSKTIAHTIIITEKTTDNKFACTVHNTAEQLPVEGRFRRDKDEECSVESKTGEKDSREVESFYEVMNKNSDENESDNESENEKSEDSVSEEMNIEELIVLTENKEMKNLAYHEELNALLDSDSDVSTTVSPVRPAYPATADPVDSFSGISPEDLELTNELDSSPIMVISTDTEISRTVIPHQSTTSPGMFLEMTYSSESTEDSFHAFLSLSENLNNGIENENENDVVMDELDGKTLLLNSSLIADKKSSPIMNQTRSIDNDDCKEEEEMLVISPTIIAEAEEMDDIKIQMDIPTEEIIITNDTAVLVRKRAEEYSERNEIVKKSKMEKIKTSRRCISLSTTESVKNVPGECSVERSLCSTNLTCFSPKKSESDFVDMDTQNTDISELDDFTATAITTATTATANVTVVCDVERQEQTMDTSYNTSNNFNINTQNSNNNTCNITNEVVLEVEVAVEVTLDSAKDRAMGRMSIRNQIAKWKYGWEIASFCAAQAARQKLGLLSPL